MNHLIDNVELICNNGHNGIWCFELQSVTLEGEPQYDTLKLDYVKKEVRINNSYSGVVFAYCPFCGRKLLEV